MKIQFGFVLTTLIGLSKAAQYTFNVISIYPNYMKMYIKYNGIETEMTTSDTTFPLFTSTITADNISQYNYVLKDGISNIINESFTRTYSADNRKYEVFNRQNKDVKIPELPEPFREMFKMGTKKFKPFANNQIYNVYANCDPTVYTKLKNSPFINGDESAIDKSEVNCEVNIVTPTSHFNSNNSTFHVIGFGSRHYKKLSWTVKLGEKFMGRKSIKLRALAGDPTLMREKLATELYNAVGVPVQEGTYARLIINDDVYGLYSFNDNLSGNWIQAYVHGDGKAEVGVDYKIYVDAQHRGLRYRGENADEYHDFKPDEFNKEQYDIEDPAVYEHAITFTRLFDQWVNTYSNDPSATAVLKLEEFLNLENLLRMLVIDSLTIGLDNFWLTGANAALYYNPEKKYYQFLPYDFDLTLQAFDGLQTLQPDDGYIQDCITWTDYNDGPATDSIDHYFTKSLLKHPLILNRYRVIMAKAVRGPFNPDTVSAYIHAVADLIRDDVAWNYEVLNTIDSQFDGKVNHYTLEQFEGNLDSTPVEKLDRTVIRDGFKYGLLDFVRRRQKACLDYTKDVDVSFKENEFDKETNDDDNDKDNDNDEGNGSGRQFSFTKGFSFLFILSQWIFYFFVF